MTSSPAQSRRFPVVKVLVALLGLGVAVLIALVLFTRDPTPVKTTNILGDEELCQSCHLLAKHPAVPGHSKLAAIGCVPCHGGDGAALDKDEAHSPALGEGRGPFLPRGQYEVACARCHVIGQVKGMEKLVRGHESFEKGTCVSCHGPGHLPPEIGPSLRRVPQKPPPYLHRWLLDSQSVLATASMWSIRDATYRGHFADTKAGNQNIDALITYVLMVSDEPQRRAYTKHTHNPGLRIDKPCTNCHALGPGAAKPKGKPHRCTMLHTYRDLLDCKRCHATAATTPSKTSVRMCPQVASAVPLCETCHLRQNDGFDALEKRARRLLPKTP